MPDIPVAWSRGFRVEHGMAYSRGGRDLIWHLHQQRIVILNSIQDPESDKQGRYQIYLLLGAVDSVSSTE
jgi:hypothetical protein